MRDVDGTAVRVELARRLAEIERAMGARAFARRPLAEIAALRAIASSHGFAPVDRLAAGLAQAIGTGAGPASFGPWLERLGDAIGGGATGADAADAYVAAVMVRLGG
jgi:hypothetical protein